jgi:hypothetical protein
MRRGEAHSHLGICYFLQTSKNNKITDAVNSIPKLHKETQFKFWHFVPVSSS